MEKSIILGPPGTGKTTELLRLTAELLKKYRPDQIAYCSFTKEGAYQGKKRAKEQFKLKDKEFPYFKTLHSIAFVDGGFGVNEMVAKKHYKILSDALDMKFTGHYTEEFYTNDDKYLSVIKLRKNNPIIAENYAMDMNLQTMRLVSHNYAIMKKQMGLVDYDDIIEQFVNRNNPLPVKVAIVDEAQDLTTLQWKMVFIAFRNCDHIYIAGDDDQAIYEWSGADVRFFLGLKGDVRILNHSYRLPRTILDYSKKITKMIEHRSIKDFNHSGEVGKIIPLDSLEELKIHDRSETWLFLSRNNSRLQLFDAYLKDRGIVYNRKGTPSVGKKIVKAINIYEKARKTGSITPEDKYFLDDYLKDGCNHSLPWYDSIDLPEEEMIYYRNIIQNKEDVNNKNFRVNTIHSVKGAEADNVVLFLDVSRSAFNNMMINNDSELRVYYVAVTRARKNLFLVYPDSKFSYPLL